MTNNTLVTPGRLNELAKEINEEHTACETSVSAGLRHAVAAGRALVEAKTLCEHGRWADWLKQNFRGSIRTAQVYMGVFGRWPEIEAKAQRPAHLSLDGAVRVLAAPTKGEPIPAESKFLPSAEFPLQRRNEAAIKAIWLERAIGRMLVYGERVLRLTGELLTRLEWIGGLTTDQLGKLLSSLGREEFDGLMDAGRYYFRLRPDQWPCTSHFPYIVVLFRRGESADGQLASRCREALAGLEWVGKHPRPATSEHDRAWRQAVQTIEAVVRGQVPAPDSQSAGEAAGTGRKHSGNGELLPNSL